MTALQTQQEDDRQRYKDRRIVKKVYIQKKRAANEKLETIVKRKT